MRPRTLLFPTISLLVATGLPGSVFGQTAPSAAKHTPKTAAQKAQPSKTVSAVTITVRANNEVGGHTFTLGEIADISGNDKALKTRLAAVEVGTAPLAGLSRMLSPGDITVRLRSHQLEIPSVMVIVPPAIRITRSAHDVSVDEVAKAAIASAQEAIKNEKDTTLEIIPNGDKYTVPPGKVQILAGAYRGQATSTSISVPVSILVDGKTVQTVDVNLKIVRKVSVLVARHTIEAHDILSAQDVSLQTIVLPSGFTQGVTDLEEAVGKRATRRIMADAPIPANGLETPPAISANDKIMIEYVFGSVRITTPGIARQAGAIGSAIRVYATDTKRELDATIINAHTVRIQDDNTEN